MYPIQRVPLPPGIKLEENVFITMRDGVKLAVDVYRPEKEGRYPVILAICPYKKEAQAASPLKGYHSEGGNLSFYVPHGYIMAFATTRGAGMSQGQYNFFDILEQQDGYDLVEGIARQPWCDGNVGMLGGSYLGMSQYYVAAQRPPHLKCITPIDASTDLYRDFVYQGGGMYFRLFMSLWGVNLINECLYPGPVEGKLPPMNFFGEWLTNDQDGPWYWERSAINFIDKIEVPVMMIASASAWLHSRGQLIGYSKIRSPKRLIVGPHNSFGMYSVFYWHNEKTNKYILRWLDYWLKGVDTGIMEEPPVLIYDGGKDEWRYENEYPLTRTKWTKYYLRANPAQPSEPPQGFISAEEPGANESPDRVKMPRLRPELILNKPVLAYATEALEKDLTLKGPLTITLYGSSVTTDTSLLAWFVKVGDVAPDGSVKLITKGNLKASYREVDAAKSKPGQPWHSFQNPVKVEANKIYDYQIELQPIFHTFKAGHKLWVQIASDDPDFILENYGDLIPGPLEAENSIHHDKTHPSHLLLPVIGDAPVIALVKEPLF
ncbi:MAG: CocE/NonD family hydrolase [Pseudomonadota bacterium]